MYASDDALCIWKRVRCTMNRNIKREHRFYAQQKKIRRLNEEKWLVLIGVDFKRFDYTFGLCVSRRTANKSLSHIECVFCQFMIDENAQY